MSPPGVPGQWQVATSTARGSAHDRNQSPNQDAVRWGSVGTASGTTAWLAAVADGHGGARYVRSDRGAQFAVDAAIEQLRATSAGELAAGAGDPAALLRDHVPAVVARWRRAVDGDVAAQPFTHAERTIAQGAALDAHPRDAYGATLLIGVVTEAGVGLAQIGDGDSLVRAHGFATRPVPGDSRLVAGETTSLCMDTAAQDFRYASVPSSANPDVVVLASDGYGNSFADPDWWHSVMEDMALFLDTESFDEFALRFPAWLAESALVGGDDVSAVVLTRTPLVVAPTRLAPAAGPASDRTHLAEPRPVVAEVTAVAPEQGRAPVATRPVPAADQTSGWVGRTLVLSEPPSVGSGAPLPPAAPPTLPAGPTPPTAPPTVPPSAPRDLRPWIIAVSLLVLALLILAIVLLTRSSGDSSGPRSPGPGPGSSKTASPTAHRSTSGGSQPSGSRTRSITITTRATKPPPPTSLVPGG